MAINRLLQGSLQSGLPKFDSVWDGRSAVGSMEPISSLTLSATQDLVTFNNIPSTYSHLQVRVFLNNSGNNISTSTRFNGDTGTNYSRHILSGDGTSVSSAGNGSQPSITFIMYSGNVSNIFSTFIIDILDYANTNKNKTVRSFGGWDTNGAGGAQGQAVLFASGVWVNTSAITSITFGTAASTWSQNSSFSLYGIK